VDAGRDANFSVTFAAKNFEQLLQKNRRMGYRARSRGKRTRELRVGSRPRKGARQFFADIGGNSLKGPDSRKGFPLIPFRRILFRFPFSWLGFLQALFGFPEIWRR
jgi:hypothetical protein